MIRSILYWIILITTLLLFGVYHLPWTVHEVAAFSNNGFDLAEFMSLHPLIQNESPPLTTSLYLRMPIVIIALMLTLTAGQLKSPKMQWTWRGVALLMVLRLNPPEVFYPYGGGSLNDQQLGEMMFYGLGLIMMAIVLNSWLKRIYPILILALCGGMLYGLDQGFNTSIEIIEALQVQIETGGGYYLMLALTGVVGIMSLIDLSLRIAEIIKHMDKQKEQAQITPVLLN